MILGLVGKMGGFEAVPGLGVETCRCLLELLLLLFATVELLLLSGSPKLFLFGLPGQFMSIKGSLIGTLELLEAVDEGGETLEAALSEFNLRPPGCESTLL
jgi:hypothetical protein